MSIWVDVEVAFELPKENPGIQEVGEGLDRRGIDSPGDEIVSTLQDTATQVAERVCEIIRTSARPGCAAAQAELDFSLTNV